MPKLFSFTNLLYFWFYTFSKSYCTAAVLPVQSSECWGSHRGSSLPFHFYLFCSLPSLLCCSVPSSLLLSSLLFPAFYPLVFSARCPLWLLLLSSLRFPAFCPLHFKCLLFYSLPFALFSLLLAALFTFLAFYSLHPYPDPYPNPNPNLNPYPLPLP